MRSRNNHSRGRGLKLKKRGYHVRMLSMAEVWQFHDAVEAARANPWRQKVWEFPW